MSNIIMADVQSGGEAVLIQKTITANGTFAAADDNADGFSSVTVEVEGSAVEHHQFVHAEDWLSDSNGNARAFYGTYLAQLYEGKSNGFCFARITNNTATSFAAIYSFRDFRQTNKTAWCRSSGFSSTLTDEGASAASFYISAGSQIDIYIFQE